ALIAGLVALGVTFWFNMQSRLFLGDGGSYGIGAFIALLTVSIHNDATPGIAGAAITPLQIIAMFLIPVIDTVRLMVARKLRGGSPFEGDRNHLHHHLFNRWGWPRGLVVYAALVGIPNLVAQVEPASAWLAIVVMLSVYVWLLVTRVAEPVAAAPHAVELAPVTDRVLDVSDRAA
ncbi:MAG: hypothetical protein INF91_08760, partial [Alphaproteobacteria bacterium]|nr:hypothetical protein [Alphaproteobacteria bacterium]